MDIRRTSSQRIAAILRLKAEKLSVPQDDVEDADDFFATIKLAGDLRRAGKLDRVDLQLGLPLHRIPASNTSAELQITALGPHSNLIAQYEDHIEDCFEMLRAGTVLNASEPKLHNNIVSSGILINYGLTTIVLGGDLESDGWEFVMKHSASVLRLDAQLVKASHHGSTNGYCPGLWENHLSPKKSATAVITAFSKQQLPRPEGLNHIKSCAERVFTTSRAAIKGSPTPAAGTPARKSAFRNLAPDVVAALEATFSGAHPKGTRPHGICSFLFDEHGNFEQHSAGDAVEL